MSKYVPKRDRVARSAEQQALAVLETVCNSDAPSERKQAAAAATLEFLAARERNANKVEPLRKAVAERIKEVRTLRQDVERLTGELEAATARIAELETLASDTVNERDALRTDVSRLGEELRDARQARVRADSEMRKHQRQAEDTTKDTAKLKLSLQVLGSRLQDDDDLALRLFVEHSDGLSSELYTALGIPPKRLEKWLAGWRQYKDAPSDDLIELIHRAEHCVCVQENKSVKLPTAELATFLRVLLESRSVKVAQEIAALLQQHREDWLRRNRTPLGEVPLAMRKITPIAGRIQRWYQE